MPDPITGRLPPAPNAEAYPSPSPSPVGATAPDAAPEAAAPAAGTSETLHAPYRSTGAQAAASGARAVTSPASSPIDLMEHARVVSARAAAWDPAATSLVGARNAHHTNTEAEMRAALDGEFDWFEGDLRLDAAGVPVMAHDAAHEGSGLTLDRWLQVGAAAGRGLKIDVKEQESLPLLLAALERSGVPQGRLMINVAVGRPGAPAGLTADEVAAIRTRLPEAWIAINPIAADYGEDVRLSMVAAATAAGGRVTFPLQWDLASDDAIAELKPHGSISIWTSDQYGTPVDAEREEQRLRRRGVDGMVDLAEADSFGQWIRQPFARAAREAFDGDPVAGLRQLRRDAIPDWDRPWTLPLHLAHFAAEYAPDLSRGAYVAMHDLATASWDVATDQAADAWDGATSGVGAVLGGLPEIVTDTFEDVGEQLERLDPRGWF